LIAASTTRFCKVVGLFPAKLALNLGVICRVINQASHSSKAQETQKKSGVSNQGLIVASLQRKEGGREGKNRTTEKSYLKAE